MMDEFDSSDSEIDFSDIDMSYSLKYLVDQKLMMSLDTHYYESMILEQNEGFSRMAAGAADGSIHIYEINNECQLANILPKIPPITACYYDRMLCNIRFVDTAGNCILAGYNGGFVNLYDLRASVYKYMISYHLPKRNDAMPDTLSCFDRNCNSNNLCLGTERMHGCVKLVFYDMRHNMPIYQFSSEQNDDLTSLCFHPHNPKRLASGGVEGVIDLFNIVGIDKDIPQTSLGTYSSVASINWLRRWDGNELISCQTERNELILFDLEANTMSRIYENALITAFQCNEGDEIRLINVQPGREFNELCLLMSANNGEVTHLRTLMWSEETLRPMGKFDVPNLHAIASLHVRKNSMMVTGGNNGEIIIWKAMRVNQIDQ